MSIVDQKITPLWDGIKRYIAEGVLPYHMPGHKQGRGVHKSFADFVGPEIFKIDLTEVDGLDNLHCPEGIIARAQELAAEAFGADRTHFLVNGASAGIESLLLTFRPGDEIIIPRNMHRSLLNGLLLSGARPIFLWPEYNSDLQVVLPATDKQIIDSIDNNPQAKGIFLINPTYQGICCNLKKVMPIRNRSDLIVMVDEAHGPHFNFHSDLPDSALQLGADACVQGAHKIIGALTQAAYLHVSGKRLDKNKIKAALQIIQTTSPSYLLMASLDLARMQIATEGKALLEYTIENARYLRKEINLIPGLYSFGVEDLKGYGDYDLDITKINVNVTGFGLNGFQLMRLLREKYKIQAEMADAYNVLFLITIGDSRENVNKLIEAFRDISRVYSCKPISKNFFGEFGLPRPQMAMQPREAWQAAYKTIAIDDSIGEICAETVIPYPPGIPLIYPGESIDAEVISAIKRYKRAGFAFQGRENSGLQTIKVIA